MKRGILIAFSIVHILVSISLFFIGEKYEFIVPATNTWLPNLLVSILLLITYVFSNIETIKKIPNYIFVIYIFGISFIIAFVLFELPKYTYLEACELIEKNTGEIVNVQKDEPKGHKGFYYVYTEHQVYIINANTGDYAKRDYMK